MIVLWGLAGGVVELVNVLLRAGSIRLADSGRPNRTVVIVIVGFVLRLAWTGLIFTLALQHSPASAMAVLVGYWLFRWVGIWWVARH
jgi:hypothetical protein